MIDNLAAATCVLTAGYGNVSSTFAGTIQNTSGTIALDKVGIGTLILVGADVYTGGTTVSSGTLQLGDNVTNNGTILGAVSIDSGATLAFANLTSQTFINDISGAGTMEITTGQSESTTGSIRTLVDGAAA